MKHGWSQGSGDDAFWHGQVTGCGGFCATSNLLGDAGRRGRLGDALGEAEMLWCGGNTSPEFTDNRKMAISIPRSLVALVIEREKGKGGGKEEN
jgi:hypothetical protein